VDPLGTSAWNAVLAGRKRWVLFEPGTSRAIAKGTNLYDAALDDDEPINYFVDILPRIRRAYPTARRIECIQEPGETIFVPGGWWHAVINLDDSIGVTQNFVSRANFDAVWDKTRTGRRAMARKWFRELRNHPDPEVRALQTRAATRPPL
jgi:histone arginine demethylase JMJD6